jgi:hypothetical protein
MALLVSFYHNGRWLQIRVSPQQSAFQAIILEHGQPVSKPIVFGVGMVSSSRDAATSVISFVQHEMLELSAPNTHLRDTHGSARAP